MTLHEERPFSKTGSTLACTIITVVGALLVATNAAVCTAALIFLMENNGRNGRGVGKRGHYIAFLAHVYANKGSLKRWVSNV